MQNKMLKPLLIALAVLVLVAGAYWFTQQGPASETEGDIAAVEMEEPTLEAPAQITETSTEANAEATSQATSQEALAKPSDVKVVVEGNQATAPRSVGKIDAPVTMYDYSSLTCPHCAHAHETVLPQLIKDYVETGKLRIVFSDFPLNQQALDASKVGRCVSNDQYFAFQTLLFGSIEKWAYSDKHPDILIQDAFLTGLSRDNAESCLNDTEVEQAIIAGVKDAVEKYKVNSTPTFIFNDGAKTISGARPYAEFKAVMEELLAKK